MVVGWIFNAEVQRSRGAEVGSHKEHKGDFESGGGGRGATALSVRRRAHFSFGIGGIFRQRCSKLAAFGSKPILLMSAVGLVRDGPFQYAVIHQNSQHESLKLRSVTTADLVQQLFR